MNPDFYWQKRGFQVIIAIIAFQNLLYLQEEDVKGLYRINCVFIIESIPTCNLVLCH